MAQKKIELPIVYHPDYSIVWPDNHRFPMTKFQILHDYLLARGMAKPEQFHRPRLVSRKTLEHIHEPEYLQQFWDGTLDEKALRRTGMGWFPDLVRRTRAEVGGTVLTTRLALRHGIACNTAGGTHHAFPGYGSGFCFLNDLAVAARILLDQGRVSRILILDLDVHQGDGTAFIFRDEPSVFTFSIHGLKNFPFRKQRSDLDIAMETGADDETYLDVLESRLPDVLSGFKPDLVLYDAGVDPFRGDRLGKLALTEQGLYRRDYFVLATCVRAKIPVACVVGGGYSENCANLGPLHAILFRAAADALAFLRKQVD